MGLGKGNQPYNATNAQNPSHLVDERSNFNLRPITLEDIDKAVFAQFDRFFKVKKRLLPLVKLDADIASLKVENPEVFDNIKRYLNPPYITFQRTGKKTIGRTSPSYKPIVYSKPVDTPQGIVVEEWIVSPPIRIQLSYQFVFTSAYRTHTNLLEEQIEFYFRNKRAVIRHDNELFEIFPEDPDQKTSLEITEDKYIITLNTFVTGYLRLEPVLKRIRPNKLDVEIKECIAATANPIRETQLISTEPTPSRNCDPVIVTLNSQGFLRLESGEVNIQLVYENDIPVEPISTIDGKIVIGLPDCGVASYSIIDQNDVVLGAGEIPCSENTPIQIDLSTYCPACESVSYIVQYEDGTPIESGVEVSGGSILVIVPNIVVCEPASYDLIDSEGGFLANGFIPSGTNLPISVGNGTILLKDSGESLIESLEIKAQAIKDVIAPDAIETLNGDIWATRKSNSSTNITLKYANGVDVPTTSLSVNAIQIANLIKDLNVDVYFDASEDYAEFTINARTVGTFTSYTQDVGSSTITFNLNGSPVSMPFTTVLNDTLIIARAVFASAGEVCLIGTYV